MCYVGRGERLWIPAQSRGPALADESGWCQTDDGGVNRTIFMLNETPYFSVNG